MSEILASSLKYAVCLHFPDRYLCLTSISQSINQSIKTLIQVSKPQRERLQSVSQSVKTLIQVGKLQRERVSKITT